jgi:uncharacterized protein
MLAALLRAHAAVPRIGLAVAHVLMALALGGPTSVLAQPSAASLLERPAAAASRETATRRGLLYEIKSAAGTVYLFGTLHVGKPEFYPLNVRTNEALAASSVLYLEVNLSEAGLAQNATDLATYPEGSSLDRALSPSLMSKVDTALQRYQMPREAAVRMKPWMLGQTLLLMEAARRGYDPALASEIHLLGLAAAQHKEVRGLETLAQQFAIFDQMPEAAQQRFLEDIVDEIGGPRMARSLDALVTAWSRGDGGALESELARERAEATPYERDVLPRLIDDRNRSMADAIAELARDRNTAFVAVGALHLVGPDGVVALLRARGLTVRAL